MTPSTPHLTDERLNDYYFAGRLGDTPDPPDADHLDECPACAARYHEVASVLDSLRQDGEAEVAEIFTPDRLLAQQQRIARRVELLGHTARVISFPGQPVGPVAGTSTTRTAPRWIAAATAAGLFIGAGLGASYEWQHARPGVPGTATVALAQEGATLTARATDGDGPAPSAAADDAFLSDLERALDRPHTRELQPFDDFTPHVREVVDVR